MLTQCLFSIHLKLVHHQSISVLLCHDKVPEQGLATFGWPKLSSTRPRQTLFPITIIYVVVTRFVVYFHRSFTN